MTDETAPAEAEKLISPFPWTAEPNSYGGLWRVHDDNGFVVFADVTRDEAEYIVEACNAYPALLADRRRLQQELLEAQRANGTEPAEDDEAVMRRWLGRHGQHLLKWTARYVACAQCHDTLWASDDQLAAMKLKAAPPLSTD